MTDNSYGVAEHLSQSRADFEFFAKMFGDGFPPLSVAGYMSGRGSPDRPFEVHTKTQFGPMPAHASLRLPSPNGLLSDLQERLVLAKTIFQPDDQRGSVSIIARIPLRRRYVDPSVKSLVTFRTRCSSSCASSWLKRCKRTNGLPAVCVWVAHARREVVM